MALISQATFNCTVYKNRLFDEDIRTRPPLTETYDTVAECLLPQFKYMDTTTYLVRNLEAVADPFSANKEDTASFFSVYEYIDDQKTIESAYISTNLKVMEPLSTDLNKPIARFDSVHAVTSAKMAPSGTDDYVALNFEDVRGFDDIEIVRDGMTCAIIDCGTQHTPATTLDIVEERVDTTNVRLLCYTDSIISPSSESGDYACLHYGIIHCTNDHTYYLRAIISSVGAIYVDGIKYISQWSNGSTAWQYATIPLTKGYHVFLCTQYGFSGGSNKQVSVQIKYESEDDYMTFTHANVQTIGMQWHTLPTSKQDIAAYGSTIVRQPETIKDVSLDSLYMKMYKSIIVLARKQSELLQNEFSRIYYLRVPDRVETSALLQGTDELLLQDTTYPKLENAVVLDCLRTNVLSPYITYFYDEPTRITEFELQDSDEYNTTAYSGKQCSGFSFSIVDYLSERMHVSDIYDAIDIDKCYNMRALQYVNNSTTYLQVLKDVMQDKVVIVFKNYITIQEITIRDPLIGGVEWGLVLAFRVYGKASELVKLIDTKGEQSIIETTQENKLVSINYGDMGFIPSVFEHTSIAPDVRYGSEFILFSLDVAGQIDPITTLGNSYDIENVDSHVKYNVDAIINVAQLNIADKRTFNLYNDSKKQTLLPCSYIGYKPETETVVKTDYSTISVTITNNDIAELTNHIIDVSVPNIKSGFTATDSALNVVPICALNSNDTLTNDASAWDSTYVRMVVSSIPFEGTETVTLTPGDFSHPSLVSSGNVDGAYDVSTDIMYLPLCVTRIPQILQTSTHNMYALADDDAPIINTNIAYDVPTHITLTKILVTELSGTARTNVEVVLDVSALSEIYNCPLRVYDASTRAAMDTVGVNNDNTVTNDFKQWNGYRIRFRIPVLPSGVAHLFLIRIGNFSGDPATFVPSVQTDMTHKYHLSGTLVNSIDGTVGVENNVMYMGDKERLYQRALQCTYDGHAILTADTTNTDFSISFWFATAYKDTGILSFTAQNTMPAATNDLKFSINTEGYLQFTTTSGVGETLIADDKTYADGQWHHIVLTFEDGVGATLYADKNIVAQGSVHTRTVNTTYAVLGWADNYMMGGIDEFRIYTKVLDANNVNNLYSLFDGTLNDIRVLYDKSGQIYSPSSRITTLYDLSTLEGTPLYIYKYIDIDEAVVRWI